MVVSQAVRCDACTRRFVVDYRSDSKGQAKTIAAECPHCKKSTRVKLTQGAMMFAARRSDEASSFGQS